MTQDPAGRMEPIATLPVFFKLGGKRVVLAGGSEPAVWKAALLAAAGARVEVFAAEPHPEIVDLASGPGASVVVVRRAWCDEDLKNAALALAAIDDDAEAARFQAAAKRAGVPVNVIDKPAFCDFQFGTIVSRSPLIVGISTDGAAPVFGQAIRARIEALLPQSLRAWAEAARDWRPAVQARGFDFRGRRRFWEAFADRALATPTAAPGDADREACLAAALGLADSPGSAATLTLVGAGVGSPDGITLEAVKALQDADVVVHPDDLSPVLVGYARREATRVPLPADHSPAVAAKAVSTRWHDGRRHVWLDRGDPATCRRWAQRSAALAAEGIAVQHIAGLGRCAVCGPDCAAWDRKAS